MDKKKIILNTLQWGFFLWLLGYILGFVFFAFVPQESIGWYIMPIGATATLWVLFQKIQRERFMCFLGLGLIWAIMAIVLDNIFIVRLLKSANYYKFDVYAYYALTFLLPVGAGWWRMIIKRH